MRSWLFIGIALAALTFVVFFTAIASVSVPFVIAVVMAMIFYPLVDMLENRGVNRSIGSILVLLLVTVVIVFTAWLVWAGVYSNSEMIVAQIEAGLVALIKLTAQIVPPDMAQQIVQKAMVAIPQVLSGIGSFVVGGFSSLFALFMGVYVAFFLLYYLLSDWHNLSDWVGRHLGVQEQLGIEIANNSTAAVRTYFYALTLANIPVAASVGLTMWLLGLPLAVPVAIVTLITCYIPYLGAIVSALFAGLVALGAGGVWEAVVIVGVIIFMQNIIDPVITNYKASDELDMNPIVTLVSTLIGGILFGALGATLASPLAAVMINVQAKIKGYDSKEESEENGTSKVVGDTVVNG
jgi:predicted PurR-regulated permease PerM